MDRISINNGEVDQSKRNHQGAGDRGGNGGAVAGGGGGVPATYVDDHKQKGKPRSLRYVSLIG